MGKTTMTQEILILVILNWCQDPKYTKDSVEDCSVSIANCAIDNKGKIIEDQVRMIKCRLEGQNLLELRSLNDKLKK